jgi:hypothetical protein
MAVDRNAIVTLHERGESNSVIAKKPKLLNCVEGGKKLQGNW